MATRKGGVGWIKPRGCPGEGPGKRGTEKTGTEIASLEEGGAYKGRPGEVLDWDNSQGGTQGWGSLRLDFAEGTEWDVRE